MPEADVLFREWSGYLKPEDITQLESAYHFSKTAHEGQYRKSGEPYISHPLAVADILAQWHMDPQALTAALLHDVTEDTAVTKSDISKRFGMCLRQSSTVMRAIGVLYSGSRPKTRLIKSVWRASWRGSLRRSARMMLMRSCAARLNSSLIIT